MGDLPNIGGAPVVTLQALDAPADGPAFLEAQILPGRGMMILQARLRLPSGEIVDALHAPSPEEVARDMDGGEADFRGNRSFAYGGAVLAPFANRITGRNLEGERVTEAQIAGRTVRLPTNWGGKAPGAAQYSMHGLILDAEVPFEQTSPDRVTGRLAADAFRGGWLSATELDFEWRMTAGAVELRVTARNAGTEPLPMGIGWHPYLALPSGDRAQARLRLPAALRAEVNDYDEVLPTGALVGTAGSPYDFNGPDGAALGDLYLDDCFTALRREDGRAVIEVLDPTAGVSFLTSSGAPQVQAMQVYAPPDQAFVVVEPQFNLADPYSGLYPAGADTGMAVIAPGESLTYEARLQALSLGNRIRT